MLGPGGKQHPLFPLTVLSLKPKHKPGPHKCMCIKNLVSACTHSHTCTYFIFNLFILNTRLFLLTKGLFSCCFIPGFHRTSLLHVEEGISHSPLAGMC